MTPNKTSIKEFLQGDKQFIIPVYQRAYSWEESQLSAFLEDLKEAAKGHNQYFFGNVLLEKTNNEKFDIIDGQQRITTIIIFARALYNVLNSREKDKEMQDFLKYLEEDFLINRGRSKLEAVEYDKDYFKDYIILDEDKHDPLTLSQKRIKKAKEFFIKNLNKISTDELLKIYNILKTAEILSIPFSNKKDSVLMFELQNNRGKELTNMEKLKSYLAYQIYTHSDDANYKLNEISKIFEEIYRLINDIKIDEDAILRYFNISRSDLAFSYRENEDDKNYKRELKKITNSKDKIIWIENYVKDLKNAFVYFKEFEKLDDDETFYLNKLDVWEVYPFILKAYTLFKENKEKLKEVFKALEIVAFRDKLIKTRADLASRLNPVIKDFKDLESLIKGLKDICSDEQWYWRDENLENSLLYIFEENKNILPYLFMRYERALRKDAKDKGYKFETQEPEIEHIAPQTESGEKRASGYDRYDEDFRNEYLHCIGNLVLISSSHNKSIGNKPFTEKLESYEKSPLLQQREIAAFVDDDKWDKAAIDKRHEALEKFVLDTWSFK